MYVGTTTLAGGWEVGKAVAVGAGGGVTVVTIVAVGDDTPATGALILEIGAAPGLSDPNTPVLVIDTMSTLTAPRKPVTATINVTILFITLACHLISRNTIQGDTSNQ